MGGIGGKAEYGLRARNVMLSLEQVSSSEITARGRRQRRSRERSRATYTGPGLCVGRGGHPTKAPGRGSVHSGGRVSVGSGRENPEGEGPGTSKMGGWGFLPGLGTGYYWLDGQGWRTQNSNPTTPIEGAFRPVPHPCSLPVLPQGPAL